MGVSVDEWDQPVDDEEVARRVGLSLSQFWDVAGRGWRRLEVHEDSVGGDWWIAGEPPQVLIGVDSSHGAVVVASPLGRWQTD